MLVSPARWSHVWQHGPTCQRYHLHITTLLTVIAVTADSLFASFVKTKLWLYKVQNWVHLVLKHIVLNFEYFVSHIIHLMVTKTDYFGSVCCGVLMKKPAIFITVSTNAHHPILAWDCEFSSPSDIKIPARFVLIQSVPLIFSLGADSCRRNCVSAFSKPASSGNLESVFPV